MQSGKPQYIVAIGASTGPAEDLLQVFDHTPVSGVAYVVLQLLSNEQQAKFKAFVQSHTNLTVTSASHGFTVLADHVYLLESAAYLIILDYKLYLTSTENSHTPQLTINRFFHSLAANLGDKAIGVILGGTGGDAVEGVKAIKKSGGLIIARNPETTTRGGLPSAVIATAMADLVLEPSLMAFAILDHLRFGALLANHKDDEMLLQAILERVREINGIDLSDYQTPSLLRITKRRAAKKNFTSLASYLENLSQSADETTELAAELIVTVSGFFRNEDAFAYLGKSVLPHLAEKLMPGEEFKVWVPGCATGEEVYSLAILIAELASQNSLPLIVKIIATDIDNAALIQAAAGVYHTGISKTVTRERLERFFTKEGECYRVNAELRSMILFARHDLVKNPPYTGMHLISCRNLLRYMTPVLQKRILNMLFFGLQDNGILFLGAHESALTLTDALESVQAKFSIYKKPGAQHPVRNAISLIPPQAGTPQLSKQLTDPSTRNDSSPLSEVFNDTIVKELDALILFIDRENQVFRSYGETSRFLLIKHFSSDLEELLPKPLAVAFNVLKVTALRSSVRVMATGIGIRRGESTAKVKISIDPLTGKTRNNALMITISEDHGSNQVTERVFDENDYLTRYAVDLEEKVKQLQYKLDFAQEKLESSSAFMHSFNEELQSANEEMQSANEEMQLTNDQMESVNAELYSLNTDYQVQNNVLLELNDDLDNYYRSNINGQILVDQDLRLVKYSPGTLKQIELAATDTGKLLGEISTSINMSLIADDVSTVISTGLSKTREMESDSGRWFQILTMPALQKATNQIGGAIITLNDITQLKKTQLELSKKNQSLQRINEDLDNFIHAASHDLLAPLSNIEGSIDMMNQYSTDDPEQTSFLEVIDTSIKKFRSLIQDLAIIARVESDMLTLEPVDINDIIDNIEWSLNNKIAVSRARIVKDLSVKHILFSKKNLRSILYNLISNAIKFRSDEPPLIQISSSMRGTEVILTVQDNGRGISEAGLKHIFDMYGRLHQDVEGQGIGLYLAKKIVNAAGGKIHVQSVLEEGTTFSIYLNTGTAENPAG